jgi:hypothetical protein
LVRRRFLSRQILLSGEIIGTFERCDGGVAPDALQVRAAVSRARRCPFFGGAVFRLGSGLRLTNQVSGAEEESHPKDQTHRRNMSTTHAPSALSQTVASNSTTIIPFTARLESAGALTLTFTNLFDF